MTLEQNTDSIAHAPPPSGQPRGPLAGIRVLDVSTVHAAPITAMLLGDYGADEIKVEHPTGDPARIHGWKREGQGLWWTVISRNKRAITLSFSKPEGQELLRRLVADAAVLVEKPPPRGDGEVGPRPGPAAEDQPAVGDAAGDRLRQTGPYAQRRAFGTLMEAMSGFAHQTGQEDGRPRCRRSAWPTASPGSPARWP